MKAYSDMSEVPHGVYFVLIVSGSQGVVCYESLDEIPAEYSHVLEPSE